MRTILYAAAHGGFLKEKVPLGGGAAVFEHLLDEWSRQHIKVVPITPVVMGANAPSGSDLVRFREKAYAHFSRAFEQAATAEIMRYDPADCVVLVNDVSEGPDFDKLAAKGYPIFTIYHVDVVAYVTSIYLREKILPETTVRWYKRLRWIMPKMAGLVWDKQQASVRASRGLIVPSSGMKDVLLRCYPECSPEKIHVVPWGIWASDEPPANEAVQDLRREFGVPENADVLLTLSRISPEKGQDSFLEMLLEWEQRADYPDRPLWVFVCGEAAFMQGQRFLRRLQELAGRMLRTKVVFPGYVTGARKQAFFAMADLYVFPSRHESYGLTLLEALASGLPAVCLDTSGARSVMRAEFGALVQSREQMREAIGALLADDVERQRRGHAAQAFARGERFADRAAELARLLVG
ncbi:MAG: glycosyltransferase family 4 protein [Acidobacteriota bacterium]